MAAENLETPHWVPTEALRYLEHVTCGRPIRAIARERGVHASTILRQVRKTEERREDVLVDMALERLHASAGQLVGQSEKDRHMSAMKKIRPLPDDDRLDAEALKVLSRMAESGACLAIARDMEKAVVVRDAPDGAQLRTAIVEAWVAEALALKEWIAATGSGRVTRYHITAAGRLALKRLSELAEQVENGRAPGGRFDDEDDVGRRRRSRYSVAESPLVTLSRRRDKEGVPFLATPLVIAGERLREDFELGAMNRHEAGDWAIYMTGPMPDAPVATSGVEAAKLRVHRALNELGPGLGDVVLRCCCYLEGLESVERGLGWSARSGKIVLRIALTRLKRHYDAEGPDRRMIG